MPSSGMSCRVALVITDVSEKISSSIIRVTRIGEPRITLVVSSSCEYPPKCRFLQEPHGLTYHKTAFFTQGTVYVCQVLLRNNASLVRNIPNNNACVLRISVPTKLKSSAIALAKTGV
jgi:hypothetical protein